MTTAESLVVHQIHIRITQAINALAHYETKAHALDELKRAELDIRVLRFGKPQLTKHDLRTAAAERIATTGTPTPTAEEEERRERRRRSQLEYKRRQKQQQKTA